MNKLTCNQAMVLLDVYRGTFESSRHLKTVDADLKRLFRIGYLTRLQNESIPLVTTVGQERVKEMLGEC